MKNGEKERQVLEQIVGESHVPSSRWKGRSRAERDAEILMALARGIDELDAADGEEMKRRARAIEALLAGAKALKGEMNENAGKRWEAEEEERLAEAVWAGMSLSEAAKMLGRSERAVWMKLGTFHLRDLTGSDRRGAVQAAWRRMREKSEEE